MERSPPADTFEFVPDAWFDPVVALWTLSVGALGTILALAGGARLLGPLGTARWRPSSSRSS